MVFGRMGKLYLRALLDRTDIEVVAINEPYGGIEVAAHLLEFDTVTWALGTVIFRISETLNVRGQNITFTGIFKPIRNSVDGRGG